MNISDAAAPAVRPKALGPGWSEVKPLWWKAMAPDGIEVHLRADHANGGWELSRQAYGRLMEFPYSHPDVEVLAQRAQQLVDH